MNDGGPAFPFTYDDAADCCAVVTPGMTVRDYFAAAALQGMLSSETIVTATAKAATEANVTFRAAIVEVAYEYADTMLQEKTK